MEEPRRKVSLMLDSGAYSAWTRGVVIDLIEYANFILSKPDVWDTVVNLDVIPGSFGRAPTAKEVAASATAGWENWQELRRRLAPIGISPLHVFHQGDDFKWLTRIMDESDYLGISPGNDRSLGERRGWLDEVMLRLTDDQGWPIRRFHGFGVTSPALLGAYPWFSVDSISWAMAGGFGACYVPLHGRVHRIAFSDEGRARQEAGKHYMTYSKVEQSAIRQYVEGKGFTVEQLVVDYVKRSELNLFFFLDLEKQWVDRPWRRSETQGSFF